MKTQNLFPEKARHSTMKSIAREYRLDWQRYQKAVFAFLLVFFLIVLATTNIGFDLRDEGYYFLGYSRGQDLFFLFSGSHKLIRILPFSDHVSVNRIYRLIMIMASGWLFARALCNSFFPLRDYWKVYCWVLLANTISYLFGPPSLSYNLLNLLFLEVSFSFVLLTVYENHPVSKSTYVVRLLCLSFFLSLLVINKPSSGVLFAAYFGFDCLIRYRKNFWIGLRVIFLTGIVVLFFLGCSFYLMYANESQKIIQLLKTNQFYPGDKHMNPAFLINSIIVKPLFDQQGFLLVSLAYCVIFLLCKRRYIGQIIANTLFFFVTVFSMVYYHDIYYHGYAGSQFLYAYLFFIVIINFQFAKKRIRDIDAAQKHILMWLLVLPVIGFLGSDVPFYLGILNVAGFHMLTIFLFFDKQRLFGIASFSILLVCFAGYVHLLNPYSNPPVFKLRNRVSFSNGNVYVSDQVYKEVNAVKELTPYISKKNHLVNIGTPVGCLYLCDLNNFYTIYFNSVFLNNGYLDLIKNVGLSDHVQVLYNKNTDKVTEYGEMKRDFIAYLAVHHYTLIDRRQTKQYDLFTFERPPLALQNEQVQK